MAVYATADRLEEAAERRATWADETEASTITDDDESETVRAVDDVNLTGY